MRCLGLDLLRIAAVLLVLLRHAQLPSEYEPFLNRIQKGGWVGVDLFFVLSGFLVSGLLFKELRTSGKIDAKRFLIRRGFKIYPPFWLFIFTTIFASALFNQLIHSRSLLGELLFIQNYTSSLWNHTWSLAVEEHFYFFLTFVVLLLTKNGRQTNIRFIPLIFFITAVACLILRLANTHHSDFSFKNQVYPTHLRIDSLFFGSFLSYLYYFRNAELYLSRFSTWTITTIGLLLVSTAFIWDIEEYKWMTTFGFILVYLGAGLLVITASRIKSSSSKALNTIGIYGAASYSIYLWHMPVAKTLEWMFPTTDGITCHLRFFAYMFGSMFFGLILSKAIEAPSLRLRAKLFPVND